MVSVFTSLIFYCGVSVTEAPKEASRYLWLLTWASSISPNGLSLLSCYCHTVLEIVSSLSQHIFLKLLLFKMRDFQEPKFHAL